MTTFSFLRRMVPICAAVLLAAGCASRVSMSEVLQQPQNSEIRTRYHLWYTNPAQVSALNFMEGEFLPAGSVIKPLEIKRGTYDIFGSVSVVDGSIRFRTADGREFTIHFDERLMMMSIEEFVRNLFTVESADTIYAPVPPAELANVKAGKLLKGMHMNSVLVVLGPPAKSRTTALTNQSWLYWRSRDVVFRIIYKGDQIRQISSLDKLED